ncbi:periplasmic heavy metal sensor [Brevundimonas sp.]|uniref:periplasmic heavy metal sensor n=1 Tax=Brevundimonas sp. TaxID=1871086 RepID=UPI002BC2FD89|nr:periplasmic heavy metal sensor [Brevundimonas sp.]HWQ87458.1 periplasmic heavy metal sensor [Brevundimonas sp.]
MTSRTLTIGLGVALAVSVALNLFAVAAGASLLVTRAQVEKRVEAQHRPPRTGSPMQLIGRLDPAVRDRVRDTLRASALAARPDFEEARQKRREAVGIASSEAFDSARVATLLAQSREAELRGRARLEADAVAVLDTLEPADRRALSEILTRRGRGVVRSDGQKRAPAPAG